MGEAGHLQSNTVHRKLPPIKPIDVSVLVSPSTVWLEAPFTVTCLITNATAKERTLCVRTDVHADAQAIELTVSIYLSIAS